jgi:hypothetical protein
MQVREVEAGALVVRGAAFRLVVRYAFPASRPAPSRPPDPPRSILLEPAIVNTPALLNLGLEGLQKERCDDGNRDVWGERQSARLASSYQRSVSAAYTNRRRQLCVR